MRPNEQEIVIIASAIKFIESNIFKEQYSIIKTFE